jgi:DNA-binding XRE family transcriptional regulator
MMKLMLEQNVSLLPTTSLESPIIFDKAKAVQAPTTAPEEQERDPKVRAGIARARARLAEDLPIERKSIAYFRLRLGMSQKQLADAIGTSQPHIARIEAGRDNVLLKTANSLARALNTTLGEVNQALGYP